MRYYVFVKSSFKHTREECESKRACRLCRLEPGYKYEHVHQNCDFLGQNIVIPGRFYTNYFLRYDKLNVSVLKYLF